MGLTIAGIEGKPLGTKSARCVSACVRAFVPAHLGVSVSEKVWVPTWLRPKVKWLVSMKGMPGEAPLAFGQLERCSLPKVGPTYGTFRESIKSVTLP